MINFDPRGGRFDELEHDDDTVIDVTRQKYEEEEISKAKRPQPKLDNFKELLDPDYKVQLGIPLSRKESQYKTEKYTSNSPLSHIRRRNSLQKSMNKFGKDSDTESEDRDRLCRSNAPLFKQFNFEFPNDEELSLMMSITENLRDIMDNQDREFLLDDEHVHKAIRQMLKICNKYGKYLLFDLNYGDNSKQKEIITSFTGYEGSNKDFRGFHQELETRRRKNSELFEK